MDLISHSEMTTFMRCQREHHYAYDLRRRPTEVAEPLRFGSLVHKALEAWWKKENWAEACQSDPVATALMLGYDIRWANEPYEVLAVESEFRTPIVNPETGQPSRTFELGGKIDVVVRDLRTNEVCIIEHKTTSDDIGLGSDYWRHVSALDPQVSTYHVGGRALGYDVARCIYDVIRKPGLRPYKKTENIKYKKDGTHYANMRLADETPQEFFERVCEDIAQKPERYFARGDIVRLERDEVEHASDVWWTARLIRESQLAKRAPRNPSACKRFGRTCAYFSVCSGEASIESFEVGEKKHRELEEI